GQRAGHELPGDHEERGVDREGYLLALEVFAYDLVQGQPQAPAAQHAYDAAQQPDQPGLYHKHPQHVAVGRAEGFEYAYLPRALVDSHDHGVDDADRGHEQCQQAHGRQHHLEHREYAVHLVEEVLQGGRPEAQGVYLFGDAGGVVDGLGVHDGGGVT